MSREEFEDETYEITMIADFGIAPKDKTLDEILQKEKIPYNHKYSTLNNKSTYTFMEHTEENVTLVEIGLYYGDSFDEIYVMVGSKNYNNIENKINSLKSCIKYKNLDAKEVDEERKRKDLQYFKNHCTIQLVELDGKIFLKKTPIKRVNINNYLNEGKKKRNQSKYKKKDDKKN